ncbi:hypothetical protein [Shinella zoogloeoides]|uniref:hypothetical protein n=1 Tax=Shinella zoogloeoides TaxID=352475 RepID=UPI00273EB3A8|nr:hypothetical protein [Shinella zoogloeoides]WLR92923.1 hypothetical protein Q9316_01565 [Shinella zoogloeoides]
MAAYDYSDSEETIRRIEAVLPEEDLKALSVLLTASAIKAVDSGVSDTRAVSGLIASLATVRNQLKRPGNH